MYCSWRRRPSRLRIRFASSTASRSSSGIGTAASCSAFEPDEALAERLQRVHLLLPLRLARALVLHRRAVSGGPV